MRLAPAALLLALCLTPALRAEGADAAAARIDYMLNCQGCHTPDGAGAPGVVPDLRRTLGPLLAVPGGREFVQRVPGSATAALDDQRLARVLNWMLDEFDARPADFPDFSADEVGRLRRAPYTNVMQARAPLATRAGIPPVY